MLTQSLLPDPPKHLASAGSSGDPPPDIALIAVEQSAWTLDPQPPGQVSCPQVAVADAPWRQPAAM